MLDTLQVWEFTTATTNNGVITCGGTITYVASANSSFAEMMVVMNGARTVGMTLASLATKAAGALGAEIYKATGAMSPLMARGNIG